ATPGQDSFLDVAANLVGILIILVMVVGAHAKNVVVNAELAAASPPTPKTDVVAAEAAAASVERSMHEMEAMIDREAFEVAYRKAERDHLQATVLLAEQ